MTSIELYWRPGTCARVPFTALEEIGVAFDLNVLNVWRGDVESPEYTAVNPKKKVPALKIDDWIITENPVILRVLAKMFPQAKLMPTRDERSEVEAEEMLAWFASQLHGAVGRQRFPQHSTLSTEKACLEGIKLKARTALEQGFALLEQRLQGRDWLFGDWSIVDVYMLYIWWRAVGSGMDPAPFPRCADHGRRAEARPSVAAALDREEAEFAIAVEEGVVPAEWAPHYVGRIPPGACGR